MKKSIITTLLSTILILSTSTSVFAQGNDSDERIIVPYTQENVELYEKVPTSLAPDEIIVSDPIDPLAEIIDPGSFRIAYSSRMSNGVTYADSSKSAQALSLIKDVVLTISGYFTSTAFNVVKDVASLIYSIPSGDISLSKPGEARLSHSYSYVNKRGQVYTGSTWKTCVESQRREWYRHGYSSFATTSGSTKTGTWDYIPENGYSPINTDYASYYSNDTMLKSIALDVWKNNKAVSRFGWSF